MRLLKLAATIVIAAAPLPGSAALAASTPPAGVAITLAAPTGPFPTGTARIHLRDGARTDPLDPQSRPREVMAQLWYPSRPAAGHPLAAYAPPGEAAGLQATYEVPPGAFTATTHSRLGAPVRPGRHPVVFFHHGLCAARTDTTAVNEQLASLGFVVVALGNTHESTAVEFPGGRVERRTDPTLCEAGADPFGAAGQATLRRLLDVRVADTRFVLDQLERVNRGINPDASRTPLPRGLAGAMDTARVGMFGHSFGGGTAAAVLAADPRFVAGVDLDGFIIGPVAEAGLDRPFLLLGSSYHDTVLDPTWRTFLPALTGWHRWYRVEDAGHSRFTDIGGSAGRWGLKDTVEPGEWTANFGDIDDRTSQRIVIDLTAAFFRRFLHHRPAPILEHPTRRYPRVEDMTGTIERRVQTPGAVRVDRGAGAAHSGTGLPGPPAPGSIGTVPSTD
jgi:predicted dienelactone hydrolase